MTRGVEAVRGQLDELYQRCAPAGLRVAYLLTGDAGLAEDLVQEAFARLIGRLRHLREPAAFDAYLRRTIVNLSASHFRHQAVVRAYERRYFDTGTTQDGLAPDVQWEWITEQRAQMTTEDLGGRGLTNLGGVSFDAVTLDQLRGYDYSASKIPGNVVGEDQLVDGDVFAVSTSDGNYAKVQILRSGYDMQIRYVTYQG